MPPALLPETEPAANNQVQSGEYLTVKNSSTESSVNTESLLSLEDDYSERTAPEAMQQDGQQDIIPDRVPPENNQAAAAPGQEKKVGYVLKICGNSREHPYAWSPSHHVSSQSNSRSTQSSNHDLFGFYPLVSLLSNCRLAMDGNGNGTHNAGNRQSRRQQLQAGTSEPLPPSPRSSSESEQNMNWQSPNVPSQDPGANQSHSSTGTSTYLDISHLTRTSNQLTEPSSSTNGPTSYDYYQEPANQSCFPQGAAYPAQNQAGFSRDDFNDSHLTRHASDVVQENNFNQAEEDGMEVDSTNGEPFNTDSQRMDRCDDRMDYQEIDHTSGCTSMNNEPLWTTPSSVTSQNSPQTPESPATSPYDSSSSSTPSNSAPESPTKETAKKSNNFWDLPAHLAIKQKWTVKDSIEKTMKVADEIINYNKGIFEIPVIKEGSSTDNNSNEEAPKTRRKPDDGKTISAELKEKRAKQQKASNNHLQKKKKSIEELPGQIATMREKLAKLQGENQYATAALCRCYHENNPMFEEFQRDCDSKDADLMDYLETWMPENDNLKQTLRQFKSAFKPPRDWPLRFDLVAFVCYLQAMIHAVKLQLTGSIGRRERKCETPKGTLNSTKRRAYLAVQVMERVLPAVCLEFLIAMEKKNEKNLEELTKKWLEPTEREPQADADMRKRPHP